MGMSLEELYRHNLWANLRLIDFCASLDIAMLNATAPGTFGSVQDTLRHIIANEYSYAATVAQRPLTHRLSREDGPPRLHALREHALRSGEELLALATNLRPEAMLRGEWQGRPYEMPAAVPLMQAINHGTEHRAHIATILSTRGVQPPTLDIWMYWETRGTGNT
jgi:uncharacterized damage-inducible protein DinB